VAQLSAYQAKLREAGKAETTINGHNAHLKAALIWAKRMGLLHGAGTWPAMP
jgi:hypothetical protein